MFRVLHLLICTCIFQLTKAIDLPADYNGVILVYSHGIADTAAQVKKYVDAGIITEPYITFEYADSKDFCDPIKNKTFFEGLSATLFYYWYWLVRGRYSYSSLGQTYDIDQLKAQFDIIRMRYPKAKIILFGISRGAAAIDGLLSLYPQYAEHVAAIITESEFESMRSVVRNKIAQCNLACFVNEDTGLRLLEFLFGKFDRTEATPLEHVERGVAQAPMLLAIPRLIICSEVDTLVPATSSLAIHQKLSELGHTKLHLIKLSQGRHGDLIRGQSCKIYQQNMQAFLRRYGLISTHSS